MKNTFKWFSYLSSKWVVKQWRQLSPLAISNNTFGPGTAKEHIVQWWFNKFCKWNKSLEDEELAASHQKLRMTIESHHWSWSSYKFTSSCQRTQGLSYYSCLAFEANWKGEKAQKVVPHELTANQKNHQFKVSSSLILHNSKQFLHLIMTCNKKWILYDNQQWSAHWFDQDDAPKHFTKPNWAKKGQGHCLGVCCPSDPLKLSEPWRNLYIWEVCSADQRYTKSCSACRWQWSTERALLSSMTTPDCILNNQCFKSWTN